MGLENRLGKTSLFLLSLLLLAGCATETAQPPLVVFLVRHAEKAEGGVNPELSDAGKARAGELVRVLRDAGVERVLSSDYIRTRDTAGPIANKLGLEIELYDPNNLDGLADRLRATPGRHLVVGHSNTTPQLVGLLGGEPGSEIDESEYDRLYIVTVGSDGTTDTVLLRYGAP